MGVLSEVSRLEVRILSAIEVSMVIHGDCGNDYSLTSDRVAVGLAGFSTEGFGSTSLSMRGKRRAKRSLYRIIWRI